MRFSYNARRGKIKDSPFVSMRLCLICAYQYYVGCSSEHRLFNYIPPRVFVVHCSGPVECHVTLKDDHKDMKLYYCYLSLLVVWVDLFFFS